MKHFFIQLTPLIFLCACNDMQSSANNYQKNAPSAQPPSIPTQTQAFAQVQVKDKSPLLPLRPQVPLVEAKADWKKTFAKLSTPADIPHVRPTDNTEYYRATKNIKGKDRSISVIFGDLLQEHDAIVIATNTELGAADDDSLAIHKAAKVNDKDLMAIEVGQYQKLHNIDSFPVGSAMALNPYELEPKITLVIAAQGPKGPLDLQKPYPQKRELFSAIYNSLLKANEYGAKSVSISAISAGTDGLPLDIASELYFKAALLFFINETTSIEHIRFVSSKNEVAHPVVQKIAERFVELFP